MKNFNEKEACQQYLVKLTSQYDFDLKAIGVLCGNKTYKRLKDLTEMLEYMVTQGFSSDQVKKAMSFKSPQLTLRALKQNLKRMFEMNLQINDIMKIVSTDYAHLIIESIVSRSSVIIEKGLESHKIVELVQSGSLDALDLNKRKSRVPKRFQESSGDSPQNKKLKRTVEKKSTEHSDGAASSSEQLDLDVEGFVAKYNQQMKLHLDSLHQNQFELLQRGMLVQRSVSRDSIEGPYGAVDVCMLSEQPSEDLFDEFQELEGGIMHAADNMRVLDPVEYQDLVSPDAQNGPFALDESVSEREVISLDEFHTRGMKHNLDEFLRSVSSDEASVNAIHSDLKNS